MVKYDSSRIYIYRGYHHHQLNTWQSKGQPPAPEPRPGYSCTAILCLKDLATILQRLIDAKYLSPAHQIVAYQLNYLDDPDP